MTLSDYIADKARRQALAAACQTNAGYLWQLATRWRGHQPSTDLALRIERETARLGPFTVKKETLRPDVWLPVESNSSPLSAEIRISSHSNRDNVQSESV